MRLDFKVLWIDDQPAGVRGAIDNLQDHVEEEGFRLMVSEANDLSSAVSMISNHVWVDGIDLVLVDYDLGSGSGGEQVLRQIKAAMPYKEVVFYSARPTTELRELAYREGVEGVYCASRANLGETITGVFDALVKKVLDIDHCRGIILGATSDIDSMINSILSAVASAAETDEQAFLVEFAMKRINKALARFQAQRDALVNNGTLHDILLAHQYFTAADRLQLLIAIYDRRIGKTHTLRRTIGLYLERIVRVRNMFGHRSLIPGEEQDALRGFGDHTVDPETLRAVRRELLDFREQFRKIEALLSDVGGKGSEA